MNTYFYALALYFAAASIAFAADKADPSPFDAGIKAYEQGDYASAREQFLTALETNETAAARHNLGLTELQLKNTAETVWQLERALLLDPSNRDYSEKLGLVREQLGLTTEERNWPYTFSQIISFDIWKIITAIGFWLLVAAALLPWLSAKKASSLIQFLRICSLLALALSIAAIWLNLETRQSGIVLSTENSALRAAPAAAAPENGFARPGERAQVLDRHNDFYKIKTEGLASGWISKDDFRLLMESF